MSSLGSVISHSLFKTAAAQTLPWPQEVERRERMDIFRQVFKWLKVLNASVQKAPEIVD